MATLVKKALLLCLAVTGALGLFVLCPWLPNEPFRNITRKHAILEHVQGKKVILVGGSGVANGLSAKVIAQNLSGYRAVNMGLNAGLGLQFNLNEVAEQVKPGDIVLLSPEYDNFEDGGRGGVQLLKAINVVPGASRYLSRERCLELVEREGLTFLQVKAASYFNGFLGLFTRSSFGIDDSGDRTSNAMVRDVARMPFCFKPDPASYRECVRVLNGFDRYCKSRGAVAVLSFPALASPQYAAARREIDRLYADLQKDTTVLLLHAPAENRFPVACFTDTYYHLNTAGRQLRSQRTADLIRGALAQGRLHFAAPVLAACRSGSWCGPAAPTW